MNDNQEKMHDKFWAMIRNDRTLSRIETVEVLSKLARELADSIKQSDIGGRR